MHVRKLLHLLMVVICITICNTATQDNGRMLKTNGEVITQKSDSTNINVDYKKAETTNPVQHVTGTTLTSNIETNTSKVETRYQKESSNASIITDLKKEELVSSTQVSQTTEDITDKTSTNINIESQNATENTEAEVAANEPAENEDEECQSSERQSNIPSDTIMIKGQCIPIVYGPISQYLVDTYDVVQHEGAYEDSKNTFLLGHNNRSFSILDSVCCGEIIAVNNYGITKNYLVERSELAIVTEDERDFILLSDGSNVVFKDFGRPAFVFITCAKGYDRNYRWIVVATELD